MQNGIVQNSIPFERFVRHDRNSACVYLCETLCNILCIWDPYLGIGDYYCRPCRRQSCAFMETGKKLDQPDKRNLDACVGIRSN